MAQRSSRQQYPRSRSTRYVDGSLAYDYGYQEKEPRKKRSQPTKRPAAKKARAPRRRERIHIPPLVFVSLTCAAAIMLMLLMSYAQLAVISNHVVEKQKELTSLQDEHVTLVARYERTFDLSAIREAAEKAGMAKPSSSQVYYLDLSAPDSVVLYQEPKESVIERAAKTAKDKIMAVVEYFK